jgi:lipopolysaccharide biosynthesis glycosyltransferase
MKFEINIENYIVTETPIYIIEVDIETLNFKELSNEIDEFNKEIIDLKENLSQALETLRR